METVVDSSGVTFENRISMRLSSRTDGLGWCGCVDEDEMVPLILTYLEVVATRIQAASRDTWTDAYSRIQEMGVVGTILALTCDSAGWTEHGGNVHGAWLTAKGREALHDLRLYVPPQPGQE
jgi:hypothetical protein